MKNDMLKTVSIIMIIIFVVFLAGIGALYGISKNKKANKDIPQAREVIETTDAEDTDEIAAEPEKETIEPQEVVSKEKPEVEQKVTVDEAKEESEDEPTTGPEIGVVSQGNPEDITNSNFKFETEDISEIYVYCKAPDNMQENCWFKLQLEDGVLYYSCYYLKGEDRYVADREVINNARFKETLGVINKYTMVDSINEYRAGNHVSKVEFEPEEGSAVVAKGVKISWNDGDSFDFGYPNGAGKALVRYFKEITVWLLENQVEE